VAPPLDLKAIARQIFAETLAGIDIAETIRRKLARDGSCICCDGALIDLSRYKRICVVAMGKASVAMANGLTTLLAPDFEVGGVIVSPTPATPAATPQTTRIPDGFELFLAGHPVPTEQSFAAARAILKLLSRCDAETLVFFLISGGGSALVELPLDPAIRLSDVQMLNQLLVGCGAPIEAINCVRKHLSAIKGGRLAAAAGAATKITLGIMDVPVGHESALASGPTLPDPTTVEDACEVISHYGLLPKLPASIRAKFEHHAGVVETPKAGDSAFQQAHFETLLGMHDLFHHTHIAAEGAGFLCICDNTTDDWPLDRACEYLFAQLEQVHAENPHHAVAIISDGEVSSPVRGNGVGGRNSAFVLECVERLAGQNIAVLSAGTDGIDGVSPAAGAVADGSTLDRARALGLDPGDFAVRSDSYTFFQALGDAVVTGPTGNNLRDLRLLLSVPRH
jgi:hydroxypyruvate reductase